MKKLTLIEAAKLHSKGEKSEIIKIYENNKDILDDLPCIDIPGGLLSYEDINKK